MTFVYISVMRADFCMKLYPTVKKVNYTLYHRFCLNITKNDNIMFFPPNNPHFSRVPKRCLHWQCVGGSEKTGFVGEEIRTHAELETDRVTADAPSEHHWQPQPCGS